jgi:hypothetical protein
VTSERWREVLDHGVALKLAINRLGKSYALDMANQRLQEALLWAEHHTIGD